MKKRYLVLILLALLIAGAYWYSHTDLLRGAGSIKIVVRSMPIRTFVSRSGAGVRAGRGPVNGTVAARGTTNAVAARRGRGTSPQGRRGQAAVASNETIDSTSPPVVFDFDRKLAFTSIEVYPVSELETNAELPHPVWHLIAGTNPVPTHGFMYGQDPAILGMHFAVQGIGPEPLESGVKYRLFIQAGSDKAQRDFTAY